MKIIIWISFVLAVLFTAPAFAAPVACSYVPVLGHTDESQIPSLLLTGNDATQPIDTRVCAFYGLGTLYALDGDYGKAIVYYDKAIGWWRGYSDAYEMRGDALAAMGKVDTAADSYRLAAAAVPDRHDGLSDRCWARAVRGTGLDRALADCAAVVSEYDDDYNTFQSRCFVLYRLHRYDDAIMDCNRALQGRPRMADALYVKALAELAKGDAVAGQADVAAAKDADYRIELTYALYGIKAP